MRFGREVNMKTIGLLGGVTWESTVTYYEIINKVVAEKLGGYHSAKSLVYSVDFGEVEQLQSRGDWDGIAALASEDARRLERGGADFIVICANTMHKVAGDMQAAVSIPVFHVVDVTAREIKSGGFSKAILLGTKYTMEQEFYRDRLAECGVEAVIPNKSDRELINGVIYDELCLSIVSEASKRKYLEIIGKLADDKTAVILGCTELGRLIAQEDTDKRLFDTTVIHAEKAALYAIGMYEY
jgi:aspartate racemase